MKVLHVIKGLGRGGAETLLPETLKLHNQTRFEFHYIYFLPWKDQLVSALQQSGGKVTCLPAKNNIQIILQVWALKRYVREQGIELVHAHLPWAGVVARLLHVISGVPVIYTEHNKLERYHWLTRWMNRLTFHWQTMVIAVSEDVAQSIKKHIRTSVPVHTILNGVNTVEFQREKEAGKEIRQMLGIPAEAIVIGTVAVFREQKRLKEWMEVVAEAIKKNPTVYGLLVGDGPMRKELEQERSRLGLANQILMPGLQTAVKPFYASMDIFLMTSLFEGLPLALLEAMSMGCAIATTDAGGVKEVIRHEIDGLRVPVEDWNTLTDHVLKLAENEAIRKQLAEAARARVVAHFSLQRMVTELEQIYQSLHNPKQ